MGFFVGGAAAGIGSATNRFDSKLLSSACEAISMSAFAGYSMLKNIETKDVIVDKVNELDLIFDVGNKDVEELIDIEETKNIGTLYNKLTDALSKIQEEKNKQDALQRCSRRCTNINNSLLVLLAGYSIIVHYFSNFEEKKNSCTFLCILNLTLILSLPAQYVTHSIMASKLSSTKKNVASVAEENMKIKKLFAEFLQNLLLLQENLYHDQQAIMTKIEEMGNNLVKKRNLLIEEQTKMKELLEKKLSPEIQAQIQNLSQKMSDLEKEVNEDIISIDVNKNKVDLLTQKLQKTENFLRSRVISRSYEETGRDEVMVGEVNQQLPRVT